MNELYCDGGIIHDGKPGASSIGGTWSWVLVRYDHVIAHNSGILWASEVVDACPRGVTNNVTELLACVEALEACESGFRGRLYSDSQNTLGRVWQGWRLAGVPPWLVHRVMEQRRRLAIGVIEVTPGLLDGHPTQAELDLGVGKHRHPVSRWNVWVDEACSRLARQALAEQEQVR